jgi:hypothetical protein
MKSCWVQRRGDRERLGHVDEHHVTYHDDRGYTQHIDRDDFERDHGSIRET